MTCITVPHGFIELVEDPTVMPKRARGYAKVIPDGIKSDFVYFVVHHIALSDEDMQALTEWARERVDEIYTQAKEQL
jgi:hypothetical protein